MPANYSFPLLLSEKEIGKETTYLLFSITVKTFSIFYARFSSGGVAGAATLGGLKTSHGFQQPMIILLSPLKDGTKKGDNSNHTNTAGS